MSTPPPLPDPTRLAQAELSTLREVTTLLAKEASLDELLGCLCAQVEGLLEWGRCSILLLAEDRLHLHHGAGPSLPASYMDRIDGSPIGPKAGACGTALFLRRPVIAEDIAQDPLWEDYRSFALEAGLRACASLPILSEGEPLGSFALYRDVPGPFPEVALDILARFTDIAALAIRSHHRDRRLQENEARHRAVVEQSHEGIFLFDSTTLQVMESNPAFAALLGYTPEELQGLPITAFIAHPPEGILANVRLTLATRHHQVGERQYRRKDGSLFPVEVSAALIQWQGRQAISVVVRDLSERRRQELERLTQAERYKEAVQQSGDIVTLLDRNGIIQYESRSLLRITGWDPEELVGRPAEELIHPEDAPQVAGCLTSALDGSGGAITAYRFRRKDGSWVELESVGHALKDGSGFDGVVVTSRDVSERMAMERALRASEERLRQAQAMGRLGHWSFDLRTRAIVWSDEIFRIFRRDPAIGPPAYEEYQAYFRPRDWDLVKANLDVALATGEPQSFDIPIHWRDGSVTWHRALQKPVLEDGRIVAVVGVAQDITEHKAAEEAILRATQELHEAQALGGIGSWTLDLATREITWSPGMYRLFERDTDLPPLTFEEAAVRVLDEAGQPSVPQDLARLMGGEERVERDAVLHLKEGRRRPVHLVAHLVKRLGLPVGVRGVVQDISDRKAAEQALLASEERFRVVAEQTGQLIYDLDVVTGSVVWEGAIRAMTGFTREEMRGLDLAAWQARIHPEDRPKALAQLDQSMASLSPYQVTYRYQRRDGDFLWLEDRGVFLPGPGGWAGRMLGTLRDITPRLEAEEALRRSEQVFRDLFADSPVPMALVRVEDGVILRINQSAMALFDLGPSVIGTPYHHQAYASQKERQVILDRLAAEGSVADHPVRMRTSHGLSQVLVSANRLMHEGRPCILLAYRDVTAQQQQEEALRQSQKLESLGVLAGGIAHDFNNLLTAILGNLNLAQHHLAQDSPAQPFLGHMESAVNRAADLSRQMLAYSGRGRFRVEPVDLGRLGRDMAHLLAVSISKRVQLTTDLPADLGTVSGDPAQLQQVIMNLVTNASEAIGDQDGTIRLTLTLADLDATDTARLALGGDMAPGPHLQLEVRDNGAGMSPEVQGRMFDPFFTTKATGRGLGLSAMQGILRGHKGGLEVVSAPGAGTTFRIFLPCAPAKTAPSHPVHPAPHATNLHGRILLVDDEPPIRQGVALMLNHLGFTVEEAQDGLEAVAALEAAPTAFRCAILDLTMPRLDGWQTLPRLRALCPDLPVLLSSGYSDQGESLPPEPGLAFLAKPFRMADLKLALVALLDPK